MARDTFDIFRNAHFRSDSYDIGVGWVIAAGRDERGYLLTLQKAKSDRHPMVRVGCRYFTLKQARAHYVSQYRTRDSTRRLTARRMLALIDIAVASAKYKGWLDKGVKFNAAPRKVRR